MRRAGTYKKPSENMKSVTIFCLGFNLSLMTEGSGSRKIIKSVTVDMMDDVSQTGYVGRHLPSIEGTMTARGMQVRARMTSCVTVQHRTYMRNHLLTVLMAVLEKIRW